MIDGLGPERLALFRAAIRSHAGNTAAAAAGAPAADAVEGRTLQPREARLLIRHALAAFGGGDRAALLGLPAPRRHVHVVPGVIAVAQSAGRDVRIMAQLVSALPAALSNIFPGDANAGHLRDAVDALMQRWVRILAGESAVRPATGAPDRPAEPPPGTNPSQPVALPLPPATRRRRARGRRLPYDAEGEPGWDAEDEALLHGLLAEIRRAFGEATDAAAGTETGEAADAPLSLEEWLRRQTGPLTYGPGDAGAR